MKHLLILLTAAMGLVACGNRPAAMPSQTQEPIFNADSAYRYIDDQVALGARVPGTDAHTQCILYIINHLKACGMQINLQQGTMTNYAGQPQAVYNILARLTTPQIESRKHLLLCAHYDSRPWCDEEELYENRYLPVPAANDGASGVGVLLEIARVLSDSTHRANLTQPIDFVFFDCEDMGTPSFYTGMQREDTWCLGSQMWASEMVRQGHQGLYQYGILLDMVGAPDATFPKEYYSMQNAGDYVEKIWRVGNELGYGRYFQQQHAMPITDDHYYVNLLGGIPCVDIINYDARQNTGFPAWWHTLQDDMRHVDKTTLQAVGSTLLTVIK